MLEFKDVTFNYDGYDYLMLDKLSFSVEKGEFISFIGASGCGKSTIFRLINGLEKPNAGEIFVDGKSINEIKNYSAFMPQKDLLFPWRTIGQNLMLPLEVHGVKKEERLELARNMLDEIGLSSYFEKYPKDLSGGMKQRVSFARTLLAGGELMLLDEPFSALDSLTKISMQEWLLEQWMHFRKTIMFITHDVEEAIFLSKKIYVIQESPIRNVTEIEINLEYPRKRADLKRPEIAELKENLINMLRQEVKI